jgi:hypothetical protein
VFALGKNGGLWHRYIIKNSSLSHQHRQLAHAVAHRALAPRTVITAQWSAWKQLAVAPQNSFWDTDPVAGLSTDGHIDVFIREHMNLDTWQVYQTDATDPEAWSAPRECANVDGSAQPNATFWNTQCTFPTSDLTIQNSPDDGSLELFFRGFDGKLFMCKELHNNSKYSPPIMYDGAIFE